MSKEATYAMGSESNNEETSSRTSYSRTTTPSQSEIFSSYNNCSDCSTIASSQSKIFSDYDVNSKSSSREISRLSSPESGNMKARTLCSPLPEMAIVHRSMHDVIHTIREQQGRAVTRRLLQQQDLATHKLQCNAQIKRTSTPDSPSIVSNVPLRQAGARLEKANGVTSSSSEESGEPQTASRAHFMALKRQFKTPTKSKEETTSHSVVKRQRLFHTPSSQSASSSLSVSDASGLSQRKSNGTASEGD